MSTFRRLVGPLVVLALVAAAAITMFGGDDSKRLTAHFPRTVSIYEGSDVRVLGVPVGTVERVTPSGTDVVVEMRYDSEVELPADAKAVIIAPSVVGDRYIQVTPAYDGGEVLPDDSTLDVDRTAVPLELDQIYASIDQLTVALGPTGANRNGALTDLLETTAQNFAGQGAKFHQTIKDFAALSDTLEDNKEELFGSARELESFLRTLARNDTTVREFNESLAAVSTMLAGEREELSASLANLSTALGEVTTFVRDNRGVLGRDIKALNRVARVLVKQRDNLDETLRNAPLALNNLYLAYNPQTGTLDTNSNVGQFPEEVEADPSLFVCSILAVNDPTGALCDIVEAILPRPAALTGGRGAATPREHRDPTLGGLVEVTR